MKKIILMLFAVIAISVTAFAKDWCPLRGGTNENTVTLSHSSAPKYVVVKVYLNHNEDKEVVAFVKVTNPNKETGTQRVVIPKGKTEAVVSKNINSSEPSGTYSFELVESSCR
ncbi:MAG: hypothetical protein K2M03_02195 [Muribaculaceae bacterium]|nr:hypothetical protein [Muribaculaceae bacterium]